MIAYFCLDREREEARLSLNCPESLHQSYLDSLTPSEKPKADRRLSRLDQSVDHCFQRFYQHYVKSTERRSQVSIRVIDFQALLTNHSSFETERLRLTQRDKAAKAYPANLVLLELTYTPDDSSSSYYGFFFVPGVSIRLTARDLAGLVCARP